MTTSIIKFTYRKVTYQIQMVNRTINFLKGMVQKTYRVTKIICNCGVFQTVTIGFITVVVFLGLRFGRLKSVEPLIHFQTPIKRPLRDSSSTQPSQVMKRYESPSIRNLRKRYIKLSGEGDGELGKGSSPGKRARNDARQARQAIKSGVVEAWSPNHSNRSRPAAANRLAQKLQTVPAEGGNGLFGRFSARPAPDPHNPACAGGPKSLTVLSGQRNNELPSQTNFHEKKGTNNDL